MRFGDKLPLSGLQPSVGSVGDADDNALAETTIGLYKNECIRADSPFRRGPLSTLADVELITADYAAWFGYAGDVRRVSRDAAGPVRMLWVGGCRVRAMPGPPASMRCAASAESASIIVTSYLLSCYHRRLPLTGISGLSD